MARPWILDLDLDIWIWICRAELGWRVWDPGALEGCKYRGTYLGQLLGSCQLRGGRTM